MKNFILLIFIFLCLASEIKAQEDQPFKPDVNKSLVSFNFKILDSINNPIFTRNPNIKEIRVFERNNGEQYIYIVHVSKNVLFYDLNFIGDSLDLNSKYGPIHTISPKITMNYLHWQEKINVPTSWRIITSIYKDSVVFLSNYHTGTESSLPIAGYAPRLAGKYDDLAKEITEALKGKTLDDIYNSEIVLQGVVSRKGGNSMKNMQLLVGKQSIFSDAAIQILGSEKNRWFGASFISGVSAASKVKFYVKLKADGTVAIIAPKYMDTANLDSLNTR